MQTIPTDQPAGCTLKAKEKRMEGRLSRGTIANNTLLYSKFYFQHVFGEDVRSVRLR
jgi:hypothetical protein